MKRIGAARTTAGTLITALVAALLVAVAAGPAMADTQVTSGVALSCTTNGLGDQTGTFGTTVTDTPDPAQPGQSVTYRFTTPFAQDPPPVTASYRGGQVFWRIPAGFNVTAVSTQPPPGGSQISSTAAVQGDSVVVTSTANIPIDGSTYPAPDLLVTGTVQASAAGPGVRWLVPYRIIAEVDAQFVGRVTATCTPNNPNITVALTAVPAGPRPPVANDIGVAVPQNSAKAITLSATDADTPQAQLTYAIVTQPGHGTLTGTAPTVTYTPAVGYVGPDSFTFRVTDPQSLSDTGTVTLNVFSRVVQDYTPPTITITNPTHGAVYNTGQVINSAFSCADALLGVQSCIGTVANGAPISTTTGAHTFTVDATDEAGNKARSTVSYRVFNPALVAQPYNAVLPNSPSTANQIPMACTGVPSLSEENLPVTVSAPTQVGAGRTFTFRVAIGAGSVPALTAATNLRYTFKAPVNGTAESAAFVSGTGSSNVQASSSVVVTGGKVVMTIAGPIGTISGTAATPYTPRAFDVTVRATGAATSQVQTQFERFQIHTETLLLPQDRDCTGGDSADGEANPILTRTTVVDTTPPLAALTEPGNGDTYLVGEAQTASFVCSDAVSLTSCTGTASNGAPINTATPGIKTFLVTARDAAGNTTERFASYTVLAPTVTYTARFAAADGALLDAVAAWVNVPRADLPRVGVQFISFLRALSPGTPATPVVPPPANTGPIEIATTYPRSQEGAALDLAAQFGLNGDELHKIAVVFLGFLYEAGH